MISIINRGPANDGSHIYHLRVNNELVAIFTHERKDGLEVCLLKAAAAAKEGRLKQLSDFADLLATWSKNEL